MIGPGRPRASTIRRAGLLFVVAACVLATVAARHDATIVTLAWVVFFFYLAFCAEPLRRVVRTADVTWATTATYLLTAALCVTVIFCLPVTSYRGVRTADVSVLGLLTGHAELSEHVAQRYADATWLLAGALAVGTLALWYQVLRLARRTEWRSINHHVGDGAMLTGATLQEPVGTSVTRPVEQRPGGAR